MGPQQVTKFNLKMQDFKRILNLTLSKKRDLFNWLLNLKNFVLSSGSKNVRSVIQMALKWPFFSKHLQNIVQRMGALPTDSHSFRRLVAPPPDPICDTRVVLKYIAKIKQ